MAVKFPRELDPLDLEMVEKAFERTWDAIKDAHHARLDSDEELESALRRELIELARFNGVSDPEALSDILLTDLSDN
jgi:hypothetical protein